jgi:4-amino-4-deoxy-L-arabinose transferase-like glycosyltransferase
MRRADEAPPAETGSRQRQHDLAAFGLLLLLSWVLFFYRLGSLSFFDADEPAFAETARQMLLSGDLVTPRFNLQPRFDKPILFYWLIGAAYKAFGINEFAARVWSAAFATALTLSIYLFGRSVLHRRGALIAALAFAANLETAVLARMAVTDMALAFFVTWTLFCYFRTGRSNGSQNNGILISAYAAIGLAVLTKGPIGLVIPLLVIGLFVMVRGRAALRLSRLRPVGGLLLFALIALPWYLLVIRANGWDFVHGFFVKHHLVRYTGVISGHRGPIYYFVAVVILGFFPWCAALPRACRGLWDIRGRLRGDLTAREELLLFAWIWFGAVFVFFSLSGTKLPSYIFPGFPALALLVGAAAEPLLDRSSASQRAGRVFDRLVIGIGCSLALGVLALPLILGRVDLRRAPGGIAELRLGIAPYVSALLFVVGPVLAVLARRRGRGDLALGALAATMVLTVLVAVQRIAPAAHAALQTALRVFAESARRELGPADHLVAYDLNAPSLVFYSRRRVVSIGRGQEPTLQELAAASGRIYVVARAAAEPRLREVRDIFPLDRRGGYVLYSNRVDR